MGGARTGFRRVVATQLYMQVALPSAALVLRGGADKSLARHTSRCRRTESIV